MRPIVIYNSGQETFTDYDITLTLSYDGDMQSDFDDIRFTTTAGTPLSYFKFNRVNGISCDMYVKLPTKNLVVGQWWRVLGIIIVIAVADIITNFRVGVPTWFLPDNLILNVLSNTALDIVSSLFTVISIVFFLNTDYLKNNTQTPKQSVDLITNAL